MKRVKRVLALLAAFALVLAMAVPAFADGATTYKISVPEGSSHTYKIYQIFTGDYSAGKLSNIKWGQNSKNRGVDVGVDTKVAQRVLDELAAVNTTTATDADKLRVIEKYADLSGEGMATVSDGNSVDATAGYYLFKDTTATGDNEVYITEVVGNVTIKAKNSNVPGFEKKLKDTNDTEGTTTDWQDVADHDIGDKIPFKLEGTVPDDYVEYDSYYFAFHDEEEAGLTFNPESVKVSVDGAEIKTGFAVENSPTDGCSFEVVFSNLKDITAVQAGSKIRVEYTATLNKNAVIGGDGNLNKAQLEYSNKPSVTDSRGKTVWDNVVVFTYQVVVNKYANSVGENNKLPGAEFTLTKKLKDGTTKDITVAKSQDGKQFTFKGLDDGQYILTETKTPEGYNTIAPIEFTVTANHEISWDGAGNRSDLLTSFSGTAASGEITFTTDEGTGALTTDVINKSGTTLPSTGGMGTTVFYVVGGGLMAVAVVLLVTKKRMENKR